VVILDRLTGLNDLTKIELATNQDDKAINYRTHGCINRLVLLDEAYAKKKAKLPGNPIFRGHPGIQLLDDAVKDTMIGLKKIPKVVK
jgi:hypothetical protein